MEGTTFRKAGPLVSYKEHSFPNTYGVSKVTFQKKVHTYCRLGGDVYTNQITASFNPNHTMCDYVYLEKAIVDRFEQSDSIIEEVLQGIVEIIKDQCPEATNIHVESFINDSVPQDFPLVVEVNAYND